MLEELACGEIGLDIDYFYNLTPHQFNNIYNGWKRKKEAEYRLQMESTRLIMYAAMSPYAEKGFKITDVLEFPWEKKEKRKIRSREEIEQLFKKNGFS